MIQGAFGIETANRATELSNTAREDYAAGGTRDMKIMESYRSACDTVSALLVKRTKTKHIGVGDMIYMISSMTPDLALQTIVSSALRPAMGWG
jgi:hypothetical protein